MTYIYYVTYINQFLELFQKNDFFNLNSEDIPPNDEIYSRCIEFIAEGIAEEFSIIMWDIAEHNIYADVDSDVDGLYEAAAFEFRKLIEGSSFEVSVKNIDDEIVFQNKALIEADDLMELVIGNVDENRGFHEVALMDISCNYIRNNGTWKYALLSDNLVLDDVLDWPAPNYLPNGEIVWKDEKGNFMPRMWYEGEGFEFELFDTNGIFNQHWLNPAQYCDYDPYFLWEGGIKEPNFYGILEKCPFSITKYNMDDHVEAKKAYDSFLQFFVDKYDKYHVENTL